MKLARFPAHSPLSGRGFYVDHSHWLVLAPATLAALPSTRAIPDRDVFYLADPSGSIETRSVPALTRCYPRSFTFYLADPSGSIDHNPERFRSSGERSEPRGGDTDGQAEG